MASPKEPRSNISKERIVNTAIDLFSAKGFRGTSMRDIAKTLGINSSNIYHHFKNKEGLMLAILQTSAGQMLKELHQVCKQDIEPLERFKALVVTHVHMTVAYMKKAKVINIDEEHLSNRGDEINRRIQREILDIYLKELRTLEAMGYVRSKSLAVTAFNIFGTINWILRWYRPEGRLSLKEISDEIILFVLHGILGSGALNTNAESHRP